MQVLVVDDEPLARQRLCALLAEDGGVSVAGEAANGEDALAAVTDLRPDVVLLDVRMPGMDGLETARHLARLDAPPVVIFTTAYDDHALAAFEANALAYLMKPVRAERLAEALARAQMLRAGRDAIDAARSASSGLGARRHVSALVNGNLRLMALDDVCYFQADQGYVSAVGAGDRMLIEDPLRALEEEFAQEFVRVHRNALVNLAHVRGLEKDAEGNAVIVFRAMPERLVVSRRLLPGVRRRVRGG